jgi:DNA-binding transcriptional LysR family regulator
MRLEWIDDILAVLECGSLARAAERRFLTQSAFTRRVRSIEDSIGAALFDRRRKPVTLLPGVQALEPELRDLSARLRRLRDALKLSASQTGRSLTFVCQHALTTTVSPRIVRALNAQGESSVRVRSGNRDECLMLLLANDVDFAVIYDVPEERSPVLPKAFEAATLGSDMMIPVCTPSMRRALAEPVIPTISYPSDVFLGQVFDRSIRPRLSDSVTTSTQAETALTLAMLQFALNEIGIAWLPLSLVAETLSQGQLVRADDVLPAQPLDVRMVRLSEGQTVRAHALWDHVAEHWTLPTTL